ncbi:MAG TPA: penicillin-binding protein 2 [Cyanobacteria bacterium UBA8530]|nr:penicillin-binding protein 2 [Cyanobacteria bacterium UBA8530]
MISAPPPRLRKVVFSFIAVLAALLLGGRLFQLQILGGGDYLRRAEQNRLRITTRPAPRGILRDRHGIILASNRLAYAVTIYPVELRPDQVPGVIDRLGRLLGIPSEEIWKKWKKTAPLPVKLKHDVDARTIALIAENHQDIPGVSIDPDVVRFYPHGRFAAHLIGYTGEITDAELEKRAQQGYRAGDIIGKTGVERVFDLVLRGKAGAQQVEVDAKSRPKRVIADIPAVPGEDLTLSLDAGLQAVAEKELEGKKGAIVALDPRTGGILAMASKPDFDPNLFAKRIDAKTWRELQGVSHPMLNRAISSAYPPGSIFKIVTSVAALEGGFAKPTTRFNSTGSFRLGRWVFHDWKAGGFGSVDLNKALIWSIDTVYYELGLRMGGDRMARVARDFGLGDRTGVLLPSETKGLVPDSKWKKEVYHERWYNGESVNMSIGQGYVQVSPIQAAVLIAKAATGKLLRPKLLSPPAAEEKDDPPPGPVLKEETLKYLRENLAKVVSEGTGGTAKIEGIPTGGKTGSAESGVGHKTHAWYVCYGPTKNPTIALAVFVERMGHGGSIAAPIAQKLLKQHFGIKEKKGKEDSSSSTPVSAGD